MTDHIINQRCLSIGRNTRICKYFQTSLLVSMRMALIGNELMQIIVFTPLLYVFSHRSCSGSKHTFFWSKTSKNNKKKKKTQTCNINHLLLNFRSDRHSPKLSFWWWWRCSATTIHLSWPEVFFSWSQNAKRTTPRCAFSLANCKCFMLMISVLSRLCKENQNKQIPIGCRRTWCIFTQ